MKGSLKNKIIGTVCFAMAISAGAGTYFYTQSTKTTIKVPVLVSACEYSQKINEENIIMLEMGKFKMPPNMVRSKEELKDMYAIEDIKPNRFIYKDSFSEKRPEIAVVEKLKGEALAVHTDLAKIVGGIPKPDDFVSVSIVKKVMNDYQGGQQIVVENPESLNEIRIIEVKENTGTNVENKKDKQEGEASGLDFSSSENIKPAIIILDVLTNEQKEFLLKGEYGGDIHFALLPKAKQEEIKKQYK